MSINIISNYVNPKNAIFERYQGLNNQKIEQKVTVAKPIINPEFDQIRDLSSNEIRDYLTIDEKKALKEVFGDFNLDTNTVSPYNSPKYMEMFKGTQLDIRL